MRGCVLAGICGAGKTSTYRELVILLASRGCESLVCLPQAATLTTHTYTPGTPTDHAAAIRDWLTGLAGFLYELDARFHASQLPRHRNACRWTPTAVLEGLGFDAPLYDLPIRREELSPVEDQLARLGLHLVVLHVPAEHVRDQCVVSTRATRGPGWTTHLETLGANDAARTRHLQAQQELLLGWARTSSLPVHVIDTHQRDWNAYAHWIAALLDPPLPTPVTSARASAAGGAGSRLP